MLVGIGWLIMAALDHSCGGRVFALFAAAVAFGLFDCIANIAKED